MEVLLWVCRRAGEYIVQSPCCWCVQISQWPTVEISGYMRTHIVKVLVVEVRPNQGRTSVLCAKHYRTSAPAMQAQVLDFFQHTMGFTMHGFSVPAVDSHQHQSRDVCVRRGEVTVRLELIITDIISCLEMNHNKDVWLLYEHIVKLRRENQSCQCYGETQLCYFLHHSVGIFIGSVFRSPLVVIWGALIAQYYISDILCLHVPTPRRQAL